MPIETGPHERIWMAFPPRGYTLGDTPAEADAARSTWAAVAGAVSRFEPMTMVVDPGDVEVARRYLPEDVDLVEMPLDDAWMRDTGLTFVVDEAGHLGGVDWVFNGWGAQQWASWEKDAAVGRTMGGLVGCEMVPSTLVNEGGGIHVDGLGTVLLTETVQRDPGRNPGVSREEVEAELARTIGSTHAVWFERGLVRDYQEFGTRGHVDIIATFAAPGVVLVHDQRASEHPDHAVTGELVATLEASVDARGLGFEILRLPAPSTLRDDEGWVGYSYVNHLVVNGGVVACSFADAVDGEAREILAGAYPGREVVTVDARPLFARGGGIHCITQQQPAAIHPA